MSRAIQVQRFGDADVLEIVDRDDPQPGEGEVLVSTEALGVNWHDILWRRNMATTEARLPAGSGGEMAGTIIAVGPGVTTLSPGDRVASIPAFDPNRYSAHAERALLPVESLIAYPDCLTPAEASVHYLTSLVTWLGFREVSDLQSGDTVLITGACHVGGPYAVQIAHALGARIIATTAHESAIDYLKSLGADAVIHTETQDLVTRVDKLTDKHGVALVLDALGGPQMTLLGDVLAPRGKLLLYGTMGGNQTTFPAQAAFRKNIEFHVHCLSNFSGKPELGIPRNHEAMARAIAEVDRMTIAGQIRPQIDYHFPFGDITEAHRYLETCANHHGRIVIDMP